MKEEWSDWEERSRSRGTVRVTASDIGSERVSIKKEEGGRAQVRRKNAELRIGMFATANPSVGGFDVATKDN
jgi:hypothetical protein